MTRWRAVSGAASVVLVASMVAGCGGESLPAGGSAASSEASAPALDTSDVVGKSPEQLLAELDARAAAAEVELASVTGMAAELEGDAAVGVALSALATSAAAQAAKLMAQAESAGRFGARLADTNNQYGSMLAAAMFMTSLSVDLVNVSDNIAAGDRGSSQTSNGDSTFEMTATTGRVTQTATVNVSAGGLDGSMAVVLDAVPCPAPDGTFTVNGSIAASSQSSGGGKGQRFSVEVTISGRVDDDARIVESESTTHIEAASTEGGENVFEATIKQSTDGSVSVPSSSAGASTSAKFRSDMTQMGLALTEMIRSKALAAIQKSIESGRCVDLQVKASPRQKNLPPSSQVSITAKPRSKVDGSPTGGGVLAKLSGGSSLDPEGAKTPADAEFAYVAPAKAKEKASVSLEARSRRGVGRAQVFFDTAAGAYEVSGSIPTVPRPTRWKGVICALDKPFDIQVSGNLPGVQQFRPNGEQGGRWTYAGQAFNAPMSADGKGSYSATIAEDGSGGTLDFVFKVALHVPGFGSRTSSGPVSLTLTPRAPCEE